MNGDQLDLKSWHNSIWIDESRTLEDFNLKWIKVATVQTLNNSELQSDSEYEQRVRRISEELAIRNEICTKR